MNLALRWLVAAVFALFVPALRAQPFVAPLDGVSNTSALNAGGNYFLVNYDGANVTDWMNVSGVAQLYALGGNGAIIGTTPYGNYGIQFVTPKAIEANSSYTVQVNMGFVASLTGGSATYQLELGTVTGGVFTSLGSTTGTVPYAGNLTSGIISGAASVTVTTGATVGGGSLAVRWAQTGSLGAGTSDYFGVDDIKLSRSWSGPGDELSSLVLGAGTLTPAFDRGTDAYTLIVPAATDSLTLTPTLVQAGAGIAVKGTAVNSGSAVTVPLAFGVNTLPVVVSSTAGITRVYTVTVTRLGEIIDALNVSANSTVNVSVTQADGKIVLGGFFTAVGGTTRNRIARLNVDGTLDSAFDPNANGFVQCAVVQPDGKILIGGTFTSVGGTTRNRIARLNPDGTLDPDFDPNASSMVQCIVLQPDGKILIGGNFTSVVGTTRNRIARLNPDGTLDLDFDPNASNAVLGLALQPVGKIIVIGTFTSMGGTSRSRIARLNADGTLDTDFVPDTNGAIQCLLVQPDGRILLGGTFTTVVATARNRIARLEADGTLDSGFDAKLIGTAASIQCQSLALQADGKVLLSGAFTTFQPGGVDVTRKQVARLYPDGTLDDTFAPNPDNQTRSLALQPDGAVLLGGTFLSLQPAGATSPTSRDRFAHVLNTPATRKVFVTGTDTVTWTRGGSAPDLYLVTFELSTDAGESWTPLSPGTRVGTTANWELTGLSLPASGLIRARGLSSGGFQNGSSSLEESVVAFLPSEIAVSGQSVAITDGSLLPQTADGTDFGTLNLTSGTVVRTFTISNPGGADLTLGEGAITVGGAHAADFTLGGISLPAAIAPGGSLTFTLTFHPGAIGTRSAEVSIVSNDNEESLFNFRIQGGGFLAGNSDLSTLTVVPGPLSPAFSSGTFSYSLGTVVNGNHSLILTPVAAESHATFAFRLNGGSYATFTPGGTVPLNVGANTVEVRVTSQGGTSIRVYAIALTRSAPAQGDVDALNLDLKTGNPNVTPRVLAIALQPDGKTIIGGNFSSVLGVARFGLARLNADGTLDQSFDTNANGSVSCLAVQPDGRVLVGGQHSGLFRFGVNGYNFSQQYLARVNADGTADTSFVPSISYPGSFVTLSCLALQADGKILFGGSFTTVNGANRNHIARLNADGSLDTGFDPKVSHSASPGVYCLTVQPDGKVLLGGFFNTLQPNGAGTATARNSIARVHADGSLDTGFDPNLTFVSGSPSVFTVLVQANGQVLFGGRFSSLQPNGAGAATTRNSVARVNADGSLDPVFDPNTIDAFGSVWAIDVQADGKIMLGGDFFSLRPNGAAVTTVVTRFSRLNADGTLDLGLSPAPNSTIRSIVLSPAGQVLLGGDFATVKANGAAITTPRAGFARMMIAAATQSLTVAQTQATWTRGGTSPELSRAYLEISTDSGATWTAAGLGARVGTTANWQFSGLALPSAGQLRVRGVTAGGGTSSGLVESAATFSGFIAYTPLESWRQIHFGSPGNTGNAADLADPDLDGIGNLLEFALGLNPNTSNTLPATTALNGATMDFTYTRSKAAFASGLIFQVEAVDTLGGTWSATGVSAETILNDNGTLQSVKASAPFSGTKLFFRLSVTTP